LHPFELGDHLRVRRPSLYFHHGIYFGNNEVLQFGGRIWDKPRATIGIAPLAEFANGGTVHVVQHGRRNWFGVTLPDAEPAEKVLQRSAWLLANHPPGRYNLIGYNCEHAANWCSTGWYSESHQVRGLFLARAGCGSLALLYVAYRSRRDSLSARLFIAIGILQLIGLLGVSMYNFHIWRFWKDIGDRWRTHERIQRTQTPAAE
jgi:hypothetical protein